VAVEEVAAEVLEAVGEETLEAAATVRRFTGENVSFFSGGAVIGVVAGVGVAYLVLSKRIEAKYEQLANEEIAGMRDHYDRKLRALDNIEEKKTLDAVVKEQKYAIEENEGDGRVAYHKVEPDPETKHPEALVSGQNVFEQPQEEVPTPEWDYNKEIASRTNDTPFIIHRDEFMENRWEYGTTDLTYFEGDDTLSDDKDRVVAEQDIVGIENLGKFGHGSLDKDVVYICNPVLSMLFEVTHSDGTYAQEVHGFEPEDLKHSAVRRRPPRRSRYDDSD
jgi:uncharacterized protein with HEPN domain